MCEGVRDAAASVPKKDVLTNLIIHLAHDKGRGNDWPYDEAMDLLSEATQETPDLVGDFEFDFFSAQESRLGK